MVVAAVVVVVVVCGGLWVVWMGALRALLDSHGVQAPSVLGYCNSIGPSLEGGGGTFATLGRVSGKTKPNTASGSSRMHVLYNRLSSIRSALLRRNMEARKKKHG